MNKHFYVARDEKDIAWLHFDMADSRANVLSDETLEALDEALISLAQSHPKGLVILSDKASGFIAGADVKAFAGLKSAREARKSILRAHEIFHRLEALAFPTVALIKGFCLGGGLELALACRYRIADTSPGTRLGFPEVKLGIFPGFGGTARSVHTLGHLKALELMLSGRALDALSAQKIGLVDLAVPERQTKNAARHLITAQPVPRRSNVFSSLTGLAPLRPLVKAVFARNLAKRVKRDHCPAPFALLEHWQSNAGWSSRLYAGEADWVPELITSNTAQNLIRVFLLQERLKSLAPKQADSFRHVHVVGGGVMGGDIAAWCAFKGLNVTLEDRAPEYQGRAIKRAHEFFHKKLKDRYARQAAMDRLIPDHQGYGVSKAGVIIEAIFENVEAKTSLFVELEKRKKPGALLATNTSSIPLEKLSSALKHPDHLIGLHFFNPVAKMPLLEIVKDSNTDPGIVTKAAGFARQIDKLPLPVKSNPGFLVNRVLMPYLLEAVKMFEEGISPYLIDLAATEFGMPMGPIELADTVGLDICHAVIDKMSRTLDTSMPESLQTRVNARNYGRKSGQGYYEWIKGKSVKQKIKVEAEQLQILEDRLILRLVNEAVSCLREGVVEDADLLDASIIFGTGFAPFRGGPMHHVQTVGGSELQ